MTIFIVASIITLVLCTGLVLTGAALAGNLRYGESPGALRQSLGVELMVWALVVASVALLGIIALAGLLLFS